MNIDFREHDNYGAFHDRPQTDMGIKQPDQGTVDLIAAELARMREKRDRERREQSGDAAPSATTSPRD